MIRTRTSAVKRRWEAKGRGVKKNLSIERNRNKGNTKGVIMGTRKFPIVTSLIVTVILIVKEINYLCFSLWSVYFLLFIYI